MPAYTVIATTDYDASSPVDEDLTTAITENAEYNYNHALRAGTYLAPVRLALARSDPTLNAFSATADGTGNFSVAFVVTYSSGADDGIANFASEPTLVVTLHEVTTGSPAGELWNTPLFIHHYMTATSASGFTLQIYGDNAASSSTVRGTVDWIAVGPVTVGE